MSTVSKYFFDKKIMFLIVFIISGCSLPKYNSEADKQLYILHSDIDKQLTEWQGDAQIKNIKERPCVITNTKFVVPKENSPVPQISLLSEGKALGEKDLSFYKKIDSNIQTTETLMLTNTSEHDGWNVRVRFYSIKVILNEIKNKRNICSPVFEYYQSQRGVISTLMSNLYMYSSTIKSVNGDSK
ncbi:hypothetical protein [Raoultella terrigena]|uniref:hypothetical protein n=1 Tax=Raoultella terrigena TaxID=577 RepID=UPI000AD6205D|nr:hypothetical protein [Raoultella terrigena]